MNHGEQLGMQSKLNSYVFLMNRPSLLTSPLVQTIFLCVWQAIHLNIPPPGEPPYKQSLRRIGWSILAIIAPKMVALNAWLQYRDARMLTRLVNNYRGLYPKEQTPTWLEQVLQYLRHLVGKLGMMSMSAVLAVDRLRMYLCHRRNLRAFELEQRQLKVNDIASQLDKDQLPWTIDTAFYAICGGGVVLLDQHTTALRERTLVEMARLHPKSLLPLQRAVLQDPSKASGLAKFITCAQAFWFCSQCIARLSQNMAISLLELNTFAHCISAFFIYIFWWHKPYDVTTHIYLDLTDLPVEGLGLRTGYRSENMAKEMFSSFFWARAEILRPLIMFLTFLVYGAIHSLAWEYHFPTPAERIIWRCSSVATASTGLIVLVTILRGSLWRTGIRSESIQHARTFLHVVMYFFSFVAIAARLFLVFESFRALPNSPASIYEVPRWTAYIPHI
jgi:hypothetical protein